MISPFRFSDQNLLSVSHLFHACYLPSPCHTPWFDHTINIWCIHIMKPYWHTTFQEPTLSDAGSSYGHSVSLISSRKLRIIRMGWSSVMWCSHCRLSLSLTEYCSMKTFWGRGGIAPQILKLISRWKWVVSCKSWLLCPQYPLDRRIGEPQSWSGCCDKENKLQAMLGIEPCSSSL
jgi:hypothetical protein